jgi:hypothetical protein
VSLDLQLLLVEHETRKAMEEDGKHSLSPFAGVIELISAIRRELLREVDDELLPNGQVAEGRRFQALFDRVDSLAPWGTALRQMDKAAVRFWRTNGKQSSEISQFWKRLVDGDPQVKRIFDNSRSVIENWETELAALSAQPSDWEQRDCRRLSDACENLTRSLATARDDLLRSTAPTSVKRRMNDYVHRIASTLADLLCQIPPRDWLSNPDYLVPAIEHMQALPLPPGSAKEILRSSPDQLTRFWSNESIAVLNRLKALPDSVTFASDEQPLCLPKITSEHNDDGGRQGLNMPR